MYDVTTDEQSRPQIDALPADALPADALPFSTEARTVPELAPWNGDSLNEAGPDAPVRSLVFGPTRQGMIIYLIVEDQSRVDILKVVWLT